ncbi:Peptidase C13 family protein [Mitsuaria sp. PDC51]|uniref:C13 family peptidase n=2 Tax=unclassified Roseateles TaxID=2626991 RepID=UPI0008E34A6B|nr:C13 family peptidase [Mitsuaria sp. PDC51]SFR71135.1 Peptidase C13 family protein [Mitsuaria sp. PDC51]
MNENEEAPTAAEPARVDLAAWCLAACRVATFRAPPWERLVTNPTWIAALLLGHLLLAFGVQRLAIDGPARLYWPAVLNGWAATVLWIWISWIAVRAARQRPGAAAAPDTSVVLTLVMANSALISVAVSLLLVPLLRLIGPLESWPLGARWGVWLLPMMWLLATATGLLWRVIPSAAPRAFAGLVALAAVAIAGWLQPAMFWWPDPSAKTTGTAATDEDAATDPGLKLTEAVLAAQPRLIAEALDALPRSEPDRIKVYAVTYAPYAIEDVFKRESAVVAQAMAERFGAGDRTVQLVMNPSTTESLPWATQANLRRTLDRMGQVMDRDKDVLLLHLTSHGGRDGQLAAEAWPLESEPVTPALLKQWLDEAGIRWRVISISACYSGSWIEPLAGDDTLVMTAADATHTSYGCGSRSPLTFFGQALYVDALKDTWSFAQAHARARQLIEVREREAGKTDGYSNPQIREGAAIGEVLRRLERQQRGD